MLWHNSIRRDREVPKMEITRHYSYQPQVGLTPSGQSCILTETKSGSLFCEEDTVPLNLHEIVQSLNHTKRRTRRQSAK
jgi:hypothetical protein